MSGLANEAALPTGLPWQEPDGGWGSVGRTDLHTAIDTEGRRTETRSDFDAAYGDWDVLREDVAHRSAPERVEGDVKAALAAAERDPAGLSDAQALTLMTATGPALDALAALADGLRKATVGDDVTYVVNRNINFTNVCYTGCRFCAFAQRRTDADAYSLSMDEVGQRAEEAWVIGATEVCMQGGIHPDLPGTAYFDLVRAVKDRVPDMHVHAYSPDGDRQRLGPHRAVDRGLPDLGEGGRPGHASPAPPRRSSTTTCAGSSPRAKLPTASWIEVDQHRARGRPAAPVRR